jgi:hypothetical protein
MQEWHDLTVDNINLSLVYFVTLSKISFTKARLDGKTRQGFCLIISLNKRQGHQLLGYEQGQVFKLLLVRVVLAIKSSTSKNV